MNIPHTIILSRPDALGDAVVTLSTAGWIKHQAPRTRIIALVKEYTRPVWAQCDHVDAIITLEELRAGDAVEQLRSLKADAIVHMFPHRAVAVWAKRAGIERRVGTSHRWWHWNTCNERVDFSRKRSDLHEAQLNLKLLAPFGIDIPALPELTKHIALRRPKMPPEIAALLASDRKRVVLHPLLGSGVGWGLHNFSALIKALDPQRWQVILTGTAEEAHRYRAELPMELPHVTDLGGG